MTHADFGQLLAGLGLFLYGMYVMERAVSQLDGRGFKLFFQKYTKNKLSAIFSGTFVTAVMQSSSIVNLMVLSFVGAGMLSMRNALAVVLGANIGGTFNSWLVALLGFKTDISSFTFPIIGIAGLGMLVFKNKKGVFRFAQFCMGIGLLFLGLDFMKESMQFVIREVDLSTYLEYPLVVMLFLGFAITAVIQTSSATVVIVLSALYAHVIPIETAVAIVLGAELGTTVKIVLGSLGGIAAKKRVALGNALFNMVTTLLGFILLGPIIILLRDITGIKDPIIILVAFQSFVNIGGVVLFYFFLNYFGDLLEKKFSDSATTATMYLQHTSPYIRDTALEMMGKETGEFIRRVIWYNMEVFELMRDHGSAVKANDKTNFFSTSLQPEARYHLLKQGEGEILSFYARMSKEELSDEDFSHLNRLIAAVRNAMYAAKGMKDISHNRKEFSNSINEMKYDNYEKFRSGQQGFYAEVNRIFLGGPGSATVNELSQLLASLSRDYNDILKKSYEEAGKNMLRNADIATLFNVNLELYSSGKALIFAMRDYMLDLESAEKFGNIEE